MGGYVSVPPVLAARREHRPVVLHEQNAVPGLATRLLARGAGAVALSFADAAARLPRRARTVVTGNPVRTRILAVPASRDALRAEAMGVLDLEDGRTTVVVFGGSLGALHIDRVVAGAIEHLRERDDLQLLVLTGPRHLEVVRGPASRSMPLRVRPLPFLDRMELAYAAADAVVARAGATSIAELTVCGLASLLIPYPHATADHQDANARELERAGAALVLPQYGTSATQLADAVDGLLGDPARLAAMTAAARKLGRPDATRDIVAELRAVAK
jgi:UDP-N-acetylglucosamine--N-acetylmuramyl-(pentapeptide) pyrophosphoryl-undecaprenol N-acetylglucosamine transferase